MTTYRVIISRNTSDTDARPGMFVVAIDEADIDRFTFSNRDDADRFRSRFARSFPWVTYVTVGDTGSTWEMVARAWCSPENWTAVAEHNGFSSTVDPMTGWPVAFGDDDDDDEPELECEHCGGDHDVEDEHEMHECWNCGWSCEVWDCDECVSYGYDGNLCESCAAYEEDENYRGDPVPVTTRGCCGTRNVHHDDINETFVCDCEARRLLSERRPVTLAHPLPTLEVA